MGFILVARGNLERILSQSVRKSDLKILQKHLQHSLSTTLYKDTSCSCMVDGLCLIRPWVRVEAER